MEGSEAQRNNVFHVHHAESLHRLMRIFSGQPLKLVYPVRQNIERQIASAFVQYVSKLSQREDHLGLDPQQSGCENLPETVLADALDRYIEVRDFTRALAAWHREAHALVDPGTEPLIDARVCGAQPLELLLLTTERINQSVEALTHFSAPGKFTLRQTNKTPEQFNRVLRIAESRVRAQHSERVAAVRQEFPHLYPIRPDA